MKNTLIISSALLIMSSSCKKDKDDPPEVTSTFQQVWNVNFGGSGHDRGSGLAPAGNGGYVLAGTTNSMDGDLAGSHRLGPWLISVDANGNKLWSKTIPMENTAEALCITPSADGGYFVAGSGRTLSTGEDIWFSKVNAIGDTVWCKYLQGSKTDGIRSIFATADGGAILSGYSESTDGDFAGITITDPNTSGWVAKINSTGTIVWQKRTEAGTSIIPDYNGGYIMAQGNNLLKIDENGYKVWKKGLGSSTSFGFYSVIKTNDGGYIAAGNTPIAYDRYGYPLPDGDVCVVKTDAAGNTLWEKTYGGLQKDIGLAVANTENGYIISALTYSRDGDAAENPGSINSWLFKINGTGKIVWSNFMGATYAGFYTLIPLPGNYFVAGGETGPSPKFDKQGWIVKFKDSAL